MRKYDIKNKRNIGIIIVISVIIIIMFSLVIRMFLTSDKKEYVVSAGTLVFDKDKTIIKVEDTGIIKTKWNNDYYLKYNDNNYELGDTAISYNESTGYIYLYGRYYEIGIGDEISVTDNETVIKDSAITKFYKLADRKYLVIDKEISSLDGLLSTTDFLMVDLDKVGNATLANHKVSLKTFSETVIVTSNYTFDIANEILTYGSDIIDLKKIIGSSNTYTKEELIPEENTGSIGDSGITDVTENPNNGVGTGTGGGDGTGVGSEDSTDNNNDLVLEEIKKATKNTSIVSVSSFVNKIVVDYVVYDPYSEYTSVYLEVGKANSNELERIYLNSGDTSYTISNNIVPNTKYNIYLKRTYIDVETGEEVLESEDVSVVTKLPSLSISVPRTKIGEITYLVTTDSSYELTSGNLRILVKIDNEYKEIYNDVISLDSRTGTIKDLDIKPGLEVKLILDNVYSGDVLIKSLEDSYIFEY